MLGAAIMLTVATLALAAVFGLPLLTQRSDEVAAAVVQDARQSRVETGRRELSEANTQLIARGLPTVADPGNGATGDELVIAAATARVLSILPETTVERLRDEVAAGRTPPVLPSASRRADLPLTDGVVDALPEPGDPTLVEVPEQARRPAPAPRAPAPRAAPRNSAVRPTPVRPAPAAPPAPAPNRSRGLCLLGVLLCTS